MDGKDTNIPRGGPRTAVLALLAIGIAPTLWAADPKVAFDIPASEVSQAIIEFYKQTNVEILYASSASVSSVKTHAVVGEFDVEEALTRMLEGTGFTFEFENAHSILLKRSHEVSSVAANSSDYSSGPAQAGDGLSKVAGELTSANATQLQDVVVTGTFIHGVLDIMSPLVRVTKKEMNGSAYATVQDALQGVTSNAGGGLSDDFAGDSGNYNRGTSPNLRGLGYGATLVLVNGRRQALAGSAADFVDLSNIPWSAVERIEVLPDGTSALYGSDAIAGVVNVVMREDLDGAETQGRLASTIGGNDEKVFAQLFGSHWDTGKWLASYQYSERGALAAADRPYTSDADKTAYGGRNYRSFWGNPGNIIDPITFEPIAAVPSGQDGKSLTPDDLLRGEVNLHNTFATYDLTPERRMHSFFVNGSQKLNDHLELYGEARLGERRSEQRQFQLNQVLFVPASNPFFVDAYGGQPYVLVAYSFLDDLGPSEFRGRTITYDGTVGAKGSFGRDWHANLLASYGKEDLRWDEVNVPNPEAVRLALEDTNEDTALNPFSDGSATNPQTLEAIRATYRSRVISDIKVASFVVDGSLFDLSTGAVKVAVGVEGRQENLRQELSQMPHAQYGRDIASTFAELSLPLIGKLSEPRAIPRLELSIAGRYERYSDFGQTFNPKFGVRWAPLNWAKFRASWGTSFKAPKLLDLYDSSQNAAGPLVLVDPLSPTKKSYVLVIQGNNPHLKKESAATWTVGLDISPVTVPALAASLTYYSIDFEDRILRPGPPSPFDILLQESQWTAAITRNPDEYAVAAVCNRPEYYGVRADCLLSTPAAIIDFRQRNLAITKTNGIDLKLDYSLATSYGTFGFGLAGNHVFSFDQALSGTSPFIDVVDTVGNPLSFRARANLDWEQHGHSQHGFNAGLTLDHNGGYRDVDATLRRRIAPFTTVDLRLGYRAQRNGGWLDDVEVTLNAINVLNNAPPFVDRSFGYDVLNADPVGRVVTFYLQKSW